MVEDNSARLYLKTLPWSLLVNSMIAHTTLLVLAIYLMLQGGFWLVIAWPLGLYSIVVLFRWIKRLCIVLVNFRRLTRIDKSSLASNPKEEWQIHGVFGVLFFFTFLALLLSMPVFLLVWFFDSVSANSPFGICWSVLLFVLYFSIVGFYFHMKKSYS